MNARCVVVLIAIGILVAPLASAHGAAPIRPIDTRVLLDDDGSLEYGSVPQSDTGALDLLSLDAREARDASGVPYLVLRFAVQSETEKADGRSISVTFKADGKDTTLSLTGDGVTYNSTDFARVDGPTPIGDGTPKALDAWITYARLGVQVGSKLEDVSVATMIGDKKGDIMPGTWYSAQDQDGPVPHVPAIEPGEVPDPGEAGETLEDPPAGTYTLAGPASFATLLTSVTSFDLNKPAQTATVAIQSTAPLDQLFTITVHGPGITASVDPTSVKLASNATQNLELRVTNATADGILNVTISSDLGAFQSLEFHVMAKMKPVSITNTTTSSSSPSSTRASPELGLLGVPLALAAALLRRRNAA